MAHARVPANLKLVESAHRGADSENAVDLTHRPFSPSLHGAKSAHDSDRDRDERDHRPQSGRAGGQADDQYQNTDTHEGR